MTTVLVDRGSRKKERKKKRTCAGVVIRGVKARGQRGLFIYPSVGLWLEVEILHAYASAGVLR